VRRLLLIPAVFAAQFAVFEIGMRVTGGSEAAPAFQRLFTPDERIGHRLNPGASTHFATSEFATDIAINGLGVRGPEFPAAKPSGERRVAILGDSLVLSVQVQQPETFAQRLEDRLNGGGSRPFTRVINGGVQGYGPVEELLFYRRVVGPLRPDVILVMVFVANDAIEALDSAWRLDDSVQGLERAREDATGLSRRLVRRSMVLQTVRLRVNDVRDWLRPEQGPVLQRALTTYVPDPPADVTRGLALTRDTLGTLVREAGAEGTRVGLVLVPARFQLNDEDFGHLQAAARHAGQTLVRDAATARFAEALAPLGVPVFDLLPVLRAQPDPAGLFFRENIHFTPRGHAVVAAALEQFVREAGLLEPAP
jgi:lysophospholipase L1-like esterase